MGIVFKRIFNGGIQQRPFKAHKRYEVTDVNYSSSFEISILRGVSDNGILTQVSTSANNQIVVDPSIITGSGALTNELNSIPQTIVWNSINSTFFKRRTDIRLYETASVVSIPQNKFGDGIKPGSVSVLDNSNYPLTLISLSDLKIDDDYGLLVANELTSSTYMNSGDVLLYLDFDGSVIDRSSYSAENFILGEHSGITSNVSLGIGKFYNFNKNNNVQIKHRGHFNILNKVDNWSVSFWANIPPSQSLAGVETQTLLQKKSIETYSDINMVERVRTNNSPQYPFDISFNTELHPTSAGRIFVKASDGISTLNISSSISVNDGLFHHYVVNKSNNELSLYIDGVKNVSGSYTFSGAVNNDRDIIAGSDMVLSNGFGFSGSIAHLKIYRDALSVNSVELSSSISCSFSSTSTVVSASVLSSQLIGDDVEFSYVNFPTNASDLSHLTSSIFWVVEENFEEVFYGPEGASFSAPISSIDIDTRIIYLSAGYTILGDVNGLTKTFILSSANDTNLDRWFGFNSSSLEESCDIYAIQRKEVGYVFYKQGMIVVSDPRPRYQNIFLGNGNWNYSNKPFQLNYKATKTIEEVSILCELNRDEFNVSQNASLRLSSNEFDPRLKSIVTGSNFRPYITQVGLYNDFGDLLAIAKLGSPLKKRQDVDVTINVKFDID